MKQIIVRADDLGISEGINYGIEKSIKEGIIKSVGFMVNMEASEHGWNLVKDCDVCFGLHTNISVGKPITNPDLIPSLVNENKEFKSSSLYRKAYKDGIDFVEYDEALLEVEAQYQRFVSITHQKPHYFECHAVQSNNFYKALETVCANHQCDYLPAAFYQAVPFRNSLLYPVLEASKPDYNPYESLKKAAMQEYGNNGYCMFVCHPGYLDAYILKHSSLTYPRCMEVEMLCSQEIKDFLKDNEITVISYDDID